MERVVVASLLVLLWGLNLFGQEGNTRDWKTFAKALKVADEVGQLPKHFARCTPTTKVVCVDGECEKVAPNTFYLLGKTTAGHTYSRCDRLGCDTYDALVRESGLIENWQLVEPSGVTLKRTLSGDRSFVEVATLELQVYISFGQCESTRE